METFARLEDLIWRPHDMETFARLEDLIWRPHDMETFARLEDLIWRHKEIPVKLSICQNIHVSGVETFLVPIHCNNPKVSLVHAASALCAESHV
jgi:hypothetical protein